MPASLSALPEELLDRIVVFTNSRPSLHALTLVSKDLNRISTPHLYTSIVLTNANFQFLRPIAFLLWTSPKHRDVVRAFSVRRAYGGNLAPWPESGELESVVRRMVEKWVGKGDKEEWVRQVRDGSDALPIASLLLRTLPRVGVMRFDGFCLVDPERR